MALTRRNQLLTLIRQAAVGSVPITTPPELQAWWDSGVALYLAQTNAKRKAWRKSVIAADKDDLATLPVSANMKAMLSASIDAAVANVDAPDSTEVV